MSISTAALVEGLRKRRAQRVTAEAASAAPAETLDGLRRLLLADELERIKQVEERLSPEALGRALPEATVAARAQSEAHAKALGPTVVNAIRETVRREPQLFVDAITPAMGPAIRQAVAHAVRALVQQLNEALARALSVRGIRWRFEALRTGRPFAEVVLLHCLVYRVEQLLLVHRDSGLVVQHLEAAEGPHQDPDQVAAMLTAIDAFARDAFRERARLQRFEVGELICWIDHGQQVSLVAVVRGTAPESYAITLREAREEIEREFAPALAAFAGDAEALVGTARIMQPCLRSEVASCARRRGARYVALLFGVLLLSGAALLTLHWRAEVLRAQRFEASLATLRQEPGLVITGARDVGGRFRFEGLRDPLAAAPAAILTHAGLPATDSTFRLASFYSADSRLSVRRAEQILHPPSSVTISAAGATLRVSGRAPRSWVERAQLLAQVLPGVERVDWQVVDEEALRAELEALEAQLDSQAIHFASGSAELDAQGGALDETARLIAALAERAANADLRLTVDVVGHADARGSELQNQALRLQRAQHVVAALATRAVPAELLRPRAAASAGPLQGPQPMRCGKTGALRGSQCERRVGFHAQLQPVSGGSERTP